MLSLIKEGLTRVLYSKRIKILVIVNVCFAVFTTLMMLWVQGMINDFLPEAILGATGTNIIYTQYFIKTAGMYGSIECLFFTIGATLFIGQDFSDGTIRNKIMAGKTRGQIYLSNLVVAAVIYAIMFLSAVITYLLVGSLFFGYSGTFADNVAEIFGTLGVGLAITVFWISFVVAMVTLTQKTSSGMLISLLTLLLLPTVLSGLAATLSALPQASWLVTFVNEWLPFSQAEAITEWPISGALVCRTLLVNILLAVAFNVWGFLGFGKADVK